VNQIPVSLVCEAMKALENMRFTQTNNPASKLGFPS
jgi:hypothetical protein